MPELGGDPERIGESHGRTLVVGRERDANVAVVEDGVVGAVLSIWCSDWATRKALTP